MQKPNHILVIDDDQMNRLLIKTILTRMSCEVNEAFDGINALEKLTVLSPDLIILDMRMPRMNGLELIQKLKHDAATKNIPIMVISGQDEVTDRAKAIEAGADDFLPKPVEQIILKARVKSLLKVKAYNDYMLNYQNKLKEEVAKKTAKLQSAFNELETASKKLKHASMDTILRLSQAAEYRDPETGNHIQRIGHYSKVIGKAISLNDQKSDELLYAAPMHDVGKIGIPDNILLKPGKLSEKEFSIMKEHTMIGGKILSQSDSDMLKTAETIALTHHEKWDGTGYPNNLKGLEIPLIGRITAIADVFDALVSKRPYKDAVSMETAFSIMKQEKGKSFDPDLLDVFFKVKEDIISIRKKYRN